MSEAYKKDCEKCCAADKPCCEEHQPRFGHSDAAFDTDPSRQLQTVKRASAMSTASASASTLSTWD